MERESRRVGWRFGNLGFQGINGKHGTDYNGRRSIGDGGRKLNEVRIVL